MTYALIKNEAIIKVGSRPNWRTDDGVLTPEQWISHGYYPVVYNQQEYDPTLQRLVIKDFSEWVIEETRVVATYTVTGIPLEELREAKQQAVADMRWEVLNGGVTLPNGMPVETDEKSFSRVTSVISGYEDADLTLESEVNFKSPIGFVKITIAEIKQIAGVMGQHMQACFAAEAAHSEAIDLLETRESIAAYDITTGWPE